MNKTVLMLVLAALCSILAQPVCAETEDVDPEDMPWEIFYMNFGVYWASLDSGFRLGADNIGLGVELDLEDLLGLDSSTSVFRFDTGYRYGKTRRHHVDFTWFNFDRDSTTTVGKEITIPPEYGGGTIPANATVNSYFNLDIFELKYRYSFFLDDRADIYFGIGLYVMPIELGLGEVGYELNEESITAPLPVINFGMDFAITPKWFLKQNLEIFYLEYDGFTGSIVSTKVALEYNAWKHVGIGLGLDAFKIKVESEKGTDYPGMDFNGSITFSYIGLQLYAKVYF